MGSDDCTIEIIDKFKQGNEKQLRLFCEKMEYQREMIKDNMWLPCHQRAYNGGCIEAR